MKIRNSLIFNCIAILLMSSIVLLTGCDSKSSAGSTDIPSNIEVAVTATPSQVDVYSSVVVEAEVLEGTTPLANKEVRFTASPSVAGWFTEDTVMTDENGLAATLYHPSVEGDVTILANVTAGLSTSNASADVRVTTGGGPGIGTSGIINSIYLTADSMNLVVKSTGGVESATLRAVGLDIDGNTVPESTSISFVITNGPGGGEHLDTLGYGPYETVTDGYGGATVVLHSGTRPGTIRLRASANDTVLSNAAQIMISAGPPKYIAVAADNCNIDYWGITGNFIEIVAVVSDTFHNPVNDSTLVYFTTDEGTMVSHLTRTEDLQGIATTYWISGYPSNSYPIPDGDVWVIAETAGGTVKDSTMFLNTWTPTTLLVSGVPDSMYADGVSEATVYITGWDLNNNPVVNGTSFEGDANFLVIEEGVLEYACGGVAADRVSITSTTLQLDYSIPGGQDDGVGAFDMVEYWKLGAYYSKTVVLKTGSAYSSNCSIGGNTSVSVGETAMIDALIRDRWSNPLGNHTLVASYPGSGTAGPGTKETNEYGEAYGFSWVPADTGEFTIIITDTDPRGGVVLSTKISVE